MDRTKILFSEVEKTRAAGNHLQYGGHRMHCLPAVYKFAMRSNAVARIIYALVKLLEGHQYS